MIGAILGTVPLGLGIALNPLAIVASILILRKPDARAGGLAFVAGWASGLVLLVALPALLLPEEAIYERVSPADLPALIWVASGGFLIAAAIWTLRNRPDLGEQPAPPRWTRLIDDGGPLRLLGLGLFLSLLSLRNLVLMAAAAGGLSQAGLRVEELFIAFAVFVTVSTLGILIPLVMHLLGGAAADTRLMVWGDWLIRQSPVITAAVMVVLGAVLLGRGLFGLF